MKRLFFFLLGFYLISCAPAKSPLMQNFLNGYEPLYNGPISQISIPIKPQYKPVTLTFSLKVLEATTMGNKGHPKYDENKYNGKCRVTQSGSQLIWDFEITEFTYKGRLYKPDVPLFNGRILSDTKGLVIDVEGDSPALASADIGRKERDQFLLTMKMYIKARSLQLNPNSVKTGDWLTIRQVNEFFEPMLEIIKGVSKEDVQMFLGETNLEKIKNFEAKEIVKGWGYHNGKRVIATNVEEKLYLEKDGYIERGSIRVEGINLLAPNSFHPVKSEGLVEMEIKLRDSSYIHIKNFTDYSVTGF